MLIGKDFEKMQWEFMGYELVEPNALLSDGLLGLVAIVLAISLSKNTNYTKAWALFFFWMGPSFFLGGFSHIFFNYWGILGKIPPLFMMLIATFYAELAMNQIHFNGELQKKNNLFITIKLVGMFAFLLMFIFAVDMGKNVQLTIVVPSINSVIGFTFALVYLPLKYAKHYGLNFKPFQYAFVVTLLAALVQALKLNIHPWFDRNDFSHLLLIVSLYFYYKGIQNTKIIAKV
jgi:hypothetical protein